MVTPNKDSQSGGSFVKRAIGGGGEGTERWRAATNQETNKGESAHAADGAEPKGGTNAGHVGKAKELGIAGQGETKKKASQPGSIRKSPWAHENRPDPSRGGQSGAKTLGVTHNGRAGGAPVAGRNQYKGTPADTPEDCTGSSLITAREKRSVKNRESH